MNQGEGVAMVPWTGDQALPVEGRGRVTDAVVAGVEAAERWTGPEKRLLVSLLRSREARGIATYKRTLEIFNGRSAWRDLAEELLDAAQYAIQEAMEREKLEAALGRAFAEVEVLKALLWATLPHAGGAGEAARAHLERPWSAWEG